jgi:hypothetical protein
LALPALGLAAHPGEGGLLYRQIHPGDRQELSMRMLFHPLGEGVYLKACEADTLRGLVAALLDDTGYENADAATRLGNRLRLADDVRLLAQLQGTPVRITDRDEANAINVSSDGPFLRSLHRLEFVSLGPSRFDPTNEARS